jgi:hypothetical protein
LLAEFLRDQNLHSEEKFLWAKKKSRCLRRRRRSRRRRRRRR